MFSRTPLQLLVSKHSERHGRTQGLMPHVRSKITSIQQRGRYLWNIDIDFFQQLESAGPSPVFQHDRLEREGVRERERWWRKTAAGGHASQAAPVAQTLTTLATNILSNWNYRMTKEKETFIVNPRWLVARPVKQTCSMRLKAAYRQCKKYTVI